MVQQKLSVHSTLHFALIKQPINKFKPVQQSRQMARKAYCPTIHTVTKGLSLSAFFLPFFSFSLFPSLFLRFPTFHLRIFHSSSISTNDPSTTACHIQTSRYVLSYIPTITVYTDCPTDMLTTSDSILQFLKSHI